jgi:hypothetical protein
MFSTTNYLIPTLEQTLPPTQGKPIRWLLLSTLSIRYFEQAWQWVRGYGFRWLMERFHFTLKRGCHIEHLQLKTAQRLLNALATYCIMAWRLM